MKPSSYDYLVLKIVQNLDLLLVHSTIIVITDNVDTYIHE